jgi:PAS domain S-box-containing protein
LDSINDCITITDLNNNIIYANKTFEKVYGYTQEEVVGKKPDILRKRNEHYPDILKETLEHGWTGKIYNKKKDGTVFLIELKTNVIKDEKGNFLGAIGVAKDLTSQVENEKKLTQVEDKYNTLFNGLKDVVFETTPDGKIVEMNPAGIELLAFKSKKELSEVNIAVDLYVNPDDREKFKSELEKKGYVKDYEIRIKNKYGTELTLLETAFGVYNKNKKIKAYRGILRDITVEKLQKQRLENYVNEIANGHKKLYESESELKKTNAAKDKLLSIIAHDLRSPFTSLIGLTEFMIEDIDEMERHEIIDFATKISESSKHILSLIENLLQWSRIQSGKLECEKEKFNLHDLICEILEILNNNVQNKNIAVKNLSAKNTYVLADRNMIFSVIQNLISNAIKFTHSGGEIKVDIKGSRGFYKVIIEDNGVGMDSETLNNLFRIDVHYTSRGTNDEKGSGLGLILCKEFVEKNGGKIHVESELGFGSKFVFTVPKSK